MNNKINIIQANLLELKQLYFDTDQFSEEEIFYLKTLIYYYEGDIQLLENLLNSKIIPFISLLSEIRLQIIKQDIKLQDLLFLNQTLNYTDPQISKEWRAEAHFLLGWAYRETQRFEEARDTFKKCYKLLWDIGAKKKAVKSMLNYVVCQSSINNKKRYLLDYQMVAKKALEVGDPIVAGLCQLNMAREYRLLGSYELSIKLINQAIQNLEADRGANNYYFAIIERCNLLIELKRFTQAYSDYEILKESNLTEIKEATKVLFIKLGKKVDINISHLDPVWAEVLGQKEHKCDYNLTKHETHLLKYLSEGEKEKNDIIRYLYGDNLNFESADNRFKVLLSRLRKKDPDLILFNHGYYKLTDGKVLIIEDLHVS